MSWEKSLLVICKILRLFANTLTVDDKDSLINRDTLKQPIQMQLSQKQENIFSIFCCIFEIYAKFSTFSRKRWLNEPMYFQHFGLQNTLLDKYLKSRLSQIHSKGNMGSALKHCCNPNQTAFIISVETLLYSERHHLCHIYWSLWK